MLWLWSINCTTMSLLHYYNKPRNTAEPKYKNKYKHFKNVWKNYTRARPTARLMWYDFCDEIQKKCIYDILSKWSHVKLNHDQGNQKCGLTWFKYSKAKLILPSKILLYRYILAKLLKIRFYCDYGLTFPEGLQEIELRSKFATK